ncbi:MAG: ATP-dependent DNA helicase RecG [Paludibacteraceae bacterium]|nr:ATP-dependent DNA helicase RecG [Paludibacteraceae bacterium]
MLDQDITYCKNVGSRRADILRKELGVETAAELLEQYPYKYIDRSRFYFIHEIEDEDTFVQIKGEILEFHTMGIGKAQRMSAMFSDGHSQIELVWFKGIQYLKLQVGVPYLLFGKPSRFNRTYNFVHPELTPMAKVTPQMVSGLEPHYNTTERMKNGGLNSKAMRTIIAGLMPDVDRGLPETLQADIIQRYHLMNRTEAMHQIHFPQDTRTMQKARERLKFEELFYNQLSILSRASAQRQKTDGFVMSVVGPRFNYFYKNLLPFPLTNAQKRVIKEIHADMKSGKQMNRLLQGDVGSGKTLVALMVALLAIDNGYQTCIMAPTEILANQHMATLQELLKGSDVRVELLTGSTTKKQRAELLPALERGEIDLLVGTHALIEDTVQFANVGLVIVDEQHRFGVAQRAKLWAKNIRPPHVLVMTATPIPRTLAMTVYGDLQVSVIDELPPGRKPIQTYHYSNLRRKSINEFIVKQVGLGRQIYVVYPLIQENEELDLADLENGYNTLVQTFPQFRISMVHGKMRAADKDLQMQRFVSGETQILVATTVIEVGVNVPNASVMIIEDAQRFGLSQLHQLRGRVGRGADQSYCILLTPPEMSADTRKRMEIMVATNDGFRIAEADLQLRGPGELDGTMQSGQAFDLKIANLATDGQILELAREAANSVLDDDPTLSTGYTQVYRDNLAKFKSAVVEYREIS